MSDIKVEKGVPIPSTQHKREGLLPLGEMDIGDSILVTRKEDFYKNDAQIRSIVNWYANVVHRDKGYKFATRTVDEGVRIWRIK